MSDPILTTTLPIGMGILGLVLVGLSVREALSSSPHGKRIALTFLLLALGLLSLAMNLHLIGMTWHLHNSQKPWSLINGSGYMGLIFLSAGCGGLVNAFGKISTEQLTEKPIDIPRCNFAPIGVVPCCLY